jgi:hypothetical protein
MKWLPCVRGEENIVDIVCSGFRRIGAGTKRIKGIFLLFFTSNCPRLPIYRKLLFPKKRESISVN